MPSTAEISRAIYGAFLLARLDRNGVHFFDRSPEGCARSFAAAALAFPLFLLLLALVQPEEVWERFGVIPVIFVQTIAYAAAWAAAPLAFHGLARAFGRESLWPGYVAAYNWSQILQYAVLLGVVAVRESGLMGPLGGIAVLVVVLALYVYCGFLAAVTLRVGPLAAFAFVVADYVVSALLKGIADGILA